MIVPIEVADPEGCHFETVEATVVSGTTYTTLPTSIFRRLGVIPNSVRTFVLADSSRNERSFGRTWMRLNGREDISIVDGRYASVGASRLLCTSGAASRPLVTRRRRRCD